MKNIIYLLVLVVSTCCFGQNKTILNPKNASKSEVLLGADLLKYVDFIQDFTAFQDGGAITRPMIIEFKNHHPTKKLLPAYVVNGLEYNDNGKNNDQVAGDGIFTSAKNVTVRGLPKDVTKVHNFSSTYTGNVGRIIKFGCKTRIVPCPETSILNTCWPLSSPCNCVEFFDCEFELEL